MSDEKIYNVRVLCQNQLLLHITGERQTVIETALRVCLDSAKPWNARMNPMFNIEVYEVNP